MSRWFGGFVLLMLSGAALAIDQLQLQWGVIQADGWQLRDASLTVDWSSGQPSMVVEVARLERGDYRIDNLRLSCTAFDLLVSEADCRHGLLSFSSDWMKAASVPAAFNFRFDSRELTLSVSDISLAGGEARVVFHQQNSGWRLDAELKKNNLGRLAGLLSRAGMSVPGVEYQGAISGKLGASGDSRGLNIVSWRLQTGDCGFSNAEGSQAAEALELRSQGSARLQADSWLIKSSLTASQGMLYSDPVYLEFSDTQPLELSADLRWNSRDGTLSLDTLAFNQPAIVTGSLEAELVTGAARPLQRFDLKISQASLPGLYKTWLQPWLAGTVLEDLETEGRLLGGQLTWAAGQPQSMQLQLDRVTFKDAQGLFGVQALDGDLRWDNSETVLESRLAWRSGNVYRLQFGDAELGIAAGPSNLKLQHPLVVSLLDGELHVNEFELGLDGADVRWLLDGMLTPVSMQAFSTALGWPPLAGKLSGMIPKVRYEKGELTLGGILLVQAFDGDITLRNLRIQQPLGLVPRLWADARFDHIDLKTLTRTFSFGRIEGRLEGEIKDLYTEAWQLVAFDSYFRTPPGDDSRRRISQKAVDNISDLGGGGVSGAVSRSFLRFLEDFPYKRLGIRCRLENGICHMGGVAPAERGYYLVEGRFLPPRLDVIGYASEVDWQSLLDRLASVTQGELPTIQ